MDRGVTQTLEIPGLKNGRARCGGRRAGVVPPAERAGNTKTARSPFKAVLRPPAVIAFHGPKGGSGTTTLAAETSAFLAGSGLSTAVVDLDLAGGDLHVRLDTPASRLTYSLADLAPVADEICARILEGVLARTPCGAMLLSAPPAGREAAPLSPGALREVIRALAGRFDRVVLDTPSRMDAASMSAIEVADRLVLVTTPEFSSVYAAGRVVERSRPAAGGGGNTYLLLNRSLGAADLLDEGAVGSHLGIRVGLTLRERTAAHRRLSGRGLFVHRDRSSSGREMLNAVRSISR